MRALPAIDLREGACVQLVGGDYDAERVRLPDPAAVARRWRGAGFAALHIVDLDAASGRGDNRPAIAAVLAAAAGAELQVGGGVRSEEDILHLLALGATRVVVGTRALEEPAWLERVAARFPGRLVVAADVRERAVVTHGWARTLGRTLEQVLAGLDPLPLGGLLVTAVHREGRLAGCDPALMEWVAGRTRHALQAAGGITTLEELHDLRRAGVSAAVLGMALYTGALDERALAEGFGT